MEIMDRNSASRQQKSNGGMSPPKERLRPSRCLETGRSSTSVWTMWKMWVSLLIIACGFSISTLFWDELLDGRPGSSAKIPVSLQHPSRLPALSTEDVKLLSPIAQRSMYVQDAVVFPTNVMLLVNVPEWIDLRSNMTCLECRFSNIKKRSNVTSIKFWTGTIYIVRCERPARVNNFPGRSSKVTLGIRGTDVHMQSKASYSPSSLPSWESLVYEHLVDGDHVVVLAKGLVTRSSKRANTSTMACVFGKDGTIQTQVISAAQEVIRCRRPPKQFEKKIVGQKVSISTSSHGVMPSATYYYPNSNFFANFMTFRAENTSVGDILEHPSSKALSEEPESDSTGTLGQVLEPSAVVKSKLCACTMIWNKARFLKEWVMYHSYLGVERYFVYDNDSDDDLDSVLESLSDHNISRFIWPWIKTQQAAFSHCSMLARSHCEWVMFSDVDEFMYPSSYLRKPGLNKSANGVKGNFSAYTNAGALHRVIDGEIEKFASTSQLLLGQIQFDCHNFGPSGLEQHPEQGVTVGYNCRLRFPERHKSIVKLEAINASLLNVLHHFEMKSNYDSVRLQPNVAVVNHFKFQCWDVFKAKFIRRAGTYTTDWKKSENKTSKDRTPGLGTQAVKPKDWSSRFCEVKDSGLRNFVLRTFASPKDPKKLLWQ